jgi:hypothetical protein
VPPEFKIFRGDHNDLEKPLPQVPASAASPESSFYHPPHSVRMEQVRTAKVLSIASVITLATVLLLRGCDDASMHADPATARVSTTSL